MSSNSMTDYVEAFRANLPAGITFDATLNRYFCNDKRYLNEWEVEAYLNYIKKFGFTAISAYAVGGLEPPLVLDFDETFYRTGGTATDLVSAATHARAGNATMVDSDGVLKWAPHNFNAESNSSNYTRFTGTQITADGESPDGTAYKVYGSGGGSNFLALWKQLDSAATAGQTRSLKVLLKAGPGVSSVRLYLNYFTDNGIADFDLTEGTILYNPNNLATIEPRGNGWYMCGVTGYNAVTPLFSFYRREVRSVSSSIALDGSEYFYISTMHEYRSDLGGMVNNPSTGDSYVPTTDSARYLPRVGHHIWNGSAWVDEGYFHESEARTNLLLSSAALGVSPWVNMSGTFTQDADTSPLGTNSATRHTTTASTGAFRFRQTATGVSGSVYTVSILAKADGFDFAQIRLESNVVGGSNLRQNFDVANGTVETGNAGLTSRIEDVGFGYYRISVTFEASSSGTLGFNFVIADSATASGLPSIAGDGVSGLYWDGAQLEEGSTPSSYIPTTTSTVTRAADTLTIPSANLPWPTPEVIGPELVTNGTFDSDLTGWSSPRSNSTLSVVGGELQSSATAAGAYGSISTVGTLTAGKVYRVRADVTTSAGNANNFFRMSQNSTNNDTNGVNVSIGSGTQTTTLDEYFVVPTTAVYYIGPISVAGSSGDTVSIDNISVREINPLAVSIQIKGTMTYADEGNTVEAKLINWLSSGTNRIFYDFSTSGANTGQIQFRQNDGTLYSVASASDAYSPGINVPFNIASRHGSTFINGAVDGTALTADTTPTALPDLSSTDMQIGSDFMGTIKLFRVWADDLTDEGIEEASTNA